MGILFTTNKRASRTRVWSILLMMALAVSTSLVRPLATAAETGTTAGSATIDANTNTDDFDEDQLVRETIAAGRGDRDEQGIREQWFSDEHLGKESAFDSRKPITPKVRRYLEAFGLECEGCDNDQATRRVNRYTRELKQKEREDQEARERRGVLVRRILDALAVAGLTYIYFHREELGLDVLLQRGGAGAPAASEIDRARQRQHAAKAAAERQQRQDTQRPPPPTWLENEEREIWTPKQERQFQTALREFSGVPKKERYRLVAERVAGKSRIECLTHHRMQELRAQRNQEQR